MGNPVSTIPLGSVQRWIRFGDKLVFVGRVIWECGYSDADGEVSLGYGLFFREGEVILDPKTNEVLDRELDLIAQARVITVKEKLSIALVTTKFSNTDIIPTDIVEVIR